MSRVRKIVIIYSGGYSVFCRRLLPKGRDWNTVQQLYR